MYFLKLVERQADAARRVPGLGSLSVPGLGLWVGGRGLGLWAELKNVSKLNEAYQTSVDKFKSQSY